MKIMRRHYLISSYKREVETVMWSPIVRNAMELLSIICTEIDVRGDVIADSRAKANSVLVVRLKL